MDAGWEAKQLLFGLSAPCGFFGKDDAALLHAPLQGARTRHFIGHRAQHLVRQVLAALNHAFFEQRLDGAPNLTVLGPDQVASTGRGAPTRGHVEHGLDDLEAVALHPEDFQHIQLVQLVLKNRRPHGPVIRLLLTDGEVPRGVDAKPCGRRELALVAEVLLAEVHALVGHRVLLVQGRPDAGLEVGTDALQRLGRIPVFMKTGIFRAQQREVLGVTQRRVGDVDRLVRADDRPRVAGIEVVTVLVRQTEGRVLDDLEVVDALRRALLADERHGLLQPAGEVVVVPPRLDHQHAATGGETRVRRGLVPVPQLFTH